MQEGVRQRVPRHAKHLDEPGDGVAHRGVEPATEANGKDEHRDRVRLRAPVLLPVQELQGLPRRHPYPDSRRVYWNYSNCVVFFFDSALFLIYFL